MTTSAALAAMALGLLACSGDRKGTPEGAPPAVEKTGSAAAGRASASPEQAPAPAPAARDAGGAIAAGVQPDPEAPPVRQSPLDPATFERPPEAGQDGVVVAGIRFSDRNGANVVVLVHQVEEGGDRNNRRLWAYHYVEAAGKRRVLRTVRDKEENCELDNAARFVDGSLAVTDLDGDGLGEITFAYDLGCMSDVSPKGRKVVVLENGEKWILRGESRVDPGGGKPVGGDFTSDPPQQKWPKTLHDHATDVWQRLVDR
ncbi:MAG TPA: hypothetical protein VKB80_17400 [Kofleriaceae bacterium]|nr:hypothetical protein [Kofleriaceae bacterium]